MFRASCSCSNWLTLNGEAGILGVNQRSSLALDNNLTDPRNRVRALCCHSVGVGDNANHPAHLEGN